MLTLTVAPINSNSNSNTVKAPTSGHRWLHTVRPLIRFLRLLERSPRGDFTVSYRTIHKFTEFK